MITKKQLQEQYSLSHNTVTDTLKACGLDTSKREYSEEEINTLFLKARAMLDEGKTYGEVKDAFTQPSPLGQSSSTRLDTTAHSGEFAQQIATEVEAGTKEIIRQVASTVLARLPAMTIEVLNEMAKNNDVQAVYQKHREELLSEIPPSTALPPSED